MSEEKKPEELTEEERESAKRERAKKALESFKNSPPRLPAPSTDSDWIELRPYYPLPDSLRKKRKKN